MISAGVKDLKNNLSRLLIKVKAGEEILITERGKPVARIVKENHRDQSLHMVNNLLPFASFALSRFNLFISCFTLFDIQFSAFQFSSFQPETLNHKP
jgi:prevent-host-death family protein